MGDASVVLTAMQCGQEYRVDELSAITNLSKDRVRVVLNMAVRGGVVEVNTMERYKRNKTYKSRQMGLNL